MVDLHLFTDPMADAIWIANIAVMLWLVRVLMSLDRRLLTLETIQEEREKHEAAAFKSGVDVVPTSVNFR